MQNTNIRIMLLSATILLSSPVFAIPSSYTFQAGAGNDDVGGNSDTSYYVAASTLFSKGLSRSRIVEFRAEIGSYEYSDNDDLSGEELFLEAVYNYTPGSGFQIPTYSVGLRHLEEFASRSDLDASTTPLLLCVSYRLDDRSNILGGLQFTERDSSDESTINRYFVSDDYRLNSQWILYSTLNLADEDIDSGSGSDSSTSPAIGVRSDVASHHLPSEGAGAAAASESDNTFFTFGASYLLSSVDTLEVSFVHQEYKTSSGTVDGNIYSIDYFHRF